MNLWSLCLSVLSLIILNGPNLVFAQKKVSKKAKVSICDLTLKQGVKGKILLLKGNFMPSPEAKAKQGVGVKREIAFFELTREDQTEAGKSSGFYKRVKTKLIKRVYSNGNGCFLAKLSTGKYSMFVKEEGEWYANSFGPNGEIFEVEVKEGDFIQLDFKISHGAAF